MSTEKVSIPSLNVRGVCDANTEFIDVVAKWPGSHHDSFILRQLTVQRNFELKLYDEGWLLGDSGYSLKPWLIIPLRNPIKPAEKNSIVLSRKLAV